MGTLVVSDSAGIDTAGSCRPAGNPAALANWLTVVIRHPGARTVLYTIGAYSSGGQCQRFPMGLGAAVSN